MASSGFVNLHNHSDYSILDGYSHPGEYLKQAAKLGQVACALTDHGNLYGVFEFVKTARDLSKSKNKKNQPQTPIYVKPIVGIEAYMAPENPDGARCHEPVYYSNDPDKRADDVSMNGAYTHLTMLAINDEGFHNLIKLSTESFKRENVYYNQRMDMGMLAKWNRGLVVTTGCPSGEIQTRFRLGQDKEAYEYAERMMELFPDRYYVEVMHHNMPLRALRDPRTHAVISAPTTIEDRVLPKLVKMAKDLHLPLLATNDAHYASPEDQVHQDEMLCIQTNSRGNTSGRVYMDNPTESSSEEYINEWRKKNGLGKDDKTPFRFSFSGNDYYLKTYDEMIKQFPPDEFPGAVSNTLEIADMVGDWWSEPDLDVQHEEELYENDVKAATAGLELPSEKDTVIPGMVTVKTGERGSITLPHAGGGHTSIKAPAGKGVTWLGKTDATNPNGFDVDSSTQELIDGKKIFLGPYDLSLTKGIRPVVDIPEGWTEAEWFQKKLNDGFVQRRLAVGDSPEILEESKRRLAVEYPVFEGNDFVQYMLVVQDYINWARENGVSVGVGRGCFLPGSKVTLRNDHRVKIEKIMPGDYVRTHDGTCHVVEARFYYNVTNDDCVTVELDDGTVIKSTADHMYFVEGKGFVKGEDLKPGYKLLGSNGVILERDDDPLLTARRDESMNVWTVNSVKPFKYTGRVYDLQVEGVHNYQVEGVTVHNSVGGSEVAYLMDISRTDPIRHDLLFERFLNPERLSPPDVDTDFKASVRNKVLQYVKDKYGYDNVANIITFGTFKFKQAFRDVAKIYRMDNKEIDRISKMIPDAIDHEDPGINDLYDENSPFYPLAEDFRNAIAAGGEQWSKIQKSTAAIEGRVRQTGTHACGVIMCSQPISDYAPLCWNKSEKKARENIWTDCMVQWVYQDLESLGLIKMDFLPLSTLDVVDSTIANVEAYNTQADTAAQAASKTGDARLAEKYRDMRLPVPNFDEIEIDGMDDRETYEMLARGDSDAVFQLGSDGQKELLRKIAPDRFDDLVAINALYRPGPMNMNAHLEYADRKNGRKPAYVINEALDPVLKGTPVEDVLKHTYGLIVYQESVMQIAQRLCGFTKGQADSLRKAMGHKIEAEMIANHDRFVDGAMKTKEERGYKYSREDIEDLWQMVQEFSKYAFNKSHSVSYAINAYETAYLKCHYAPFFWAAILTQNIDDKEKFRRFLQNAIDNGLKVGPVDVNKSGIGITAAFKTKPDDPDITFGFDKVKGVNASVARELVLARRKNNGEFKDFHDFMEHAPKAMLSVSVLQSMAKAGAFDSLGVDRKPIVERAGKIIEFYSKRRSSGLKTGGGLMGILGGTAAASFERYDLHGVDYDKKTRKTIKYDDAEYGFNEKLAEEKSVLGVYVSATPVSNLGVMLPYYSMRPEWWKATTLAELERQDTESKPQDDDAIYGWRHKRKNVRLIGYLVDLEVKKMRTGGHWYKATFMDSTGSVPARISANAVTKILLTAGYSTEDVGKVNGTAVIREDVVFDVDANWEEGSISINDMAVVPLSRDGRIPLVISANTEKTLNGNAYHKMLSLFSKHPGDTPIVVDLRTLKNNETDVTISGKKISTGPVNWLPNGVEVTDDLIDQLSVVIPPDALVPWAVRGIARKKPGSPDYMDGE